MQGIAYRAREWQQRPHEGNETMLEEECRKFVIVHICKPTHHEVDLAGRK